MDNSTVMNSVNGYAAVVVKAFSPEAIILYGSYANGEARQNSDIDIAVIFHRYNDNPLTGMQSLFKLRRNIDSRIEPVLLDEQHDKSGFLKHIKQTGHVVYLKETGNNFSNAIQ